MADHPIILRELHVRRVVDVTPGIRCVTLGGEQLGAFVRDGIECSPFTTAGADDHIKILPPTGGALVLPTQEEGHLAWPDDPPAVARDYTVRRFDPAAGELDVEFVLHHDGPGARWAAKAEVGESIHIAGPRFSIEHPLDAAAYVLVGDDAALPAIAHFFDRLPAGRVTAIVVVDDVNAGYPLPAEHVTWLVRTDADADPPVDEHVRAALATHPDAYVWGALELQATRDLRAVLREQGVDRARHYVTHYWRRERRDRAAEGDAADALRSMVDLLTPTVLRVAVTVGLPEALFAGADTPATAAARTGCDEAAVGVLLGHLAAKGVVRRLDDGSYELTAIGELLRRDADNSFHGYLHLRSASGHMASALPGLLHAVETGTSGYEAVHGRTFWDGLAADADVAASFDRQLAGWASTWAPTVAADEVWTRAARVVDVGGGTGTLVAAIAEAHPLLTFTVVELDGPAKRAEELLAEHGLDGRVDVQTGSFFDPLPSGADTYVLAQVLHDWPDIDALRILRNCAAALPADGRLVVIERLVDPAEAATDHSTMSVLMLALFGARERALDDYEALLADAGLRLVDARRPSDALCLLETCRSDSPIPDGRTS